MSPQTYLLPKLFIANAVAIVGMCVLAALATAEERPIGSDLICFVQTESGQVVDLTHLCGDTDAIAPPQTAPPIAPREPARRGRGAARTETPSSTAAQPTR
ncbi:MAG: hypothetical protein AAFQ89_06295 [Cyanobacteria bacterium J06626_18]